MEGGSSGAHGVVPARRRSQLDVVVAGQTGLAIG
jgi:hypothetical protein